MDAPDLISLSQQKFRDQIRTEKKKKVDPEAACFGSTGNYVAEWNVTLCVVGWFCRKSVENIDAEEREEPKTIQLRAIEAFEPCRIYEFISLERRRVRQGASILANRAFASPSGLRGMKSLTKLLGLHCRSTFAVLGVDALLRFALVLKIELRNICCLFF
jgi:hypothetical protein